jgi:hypothetical protein
MQSRLTLFFKNLETLIRYQGCDKYNESIRRKWIERDERVYEIDKTSPGAYRPLVVAITSKTSAQRLMAQLAEERGLQDQGRYRMFAFTHPTLPGLERSR